VQPEHRVPERLRGILKKLALRQSGNTTLRVVNIAFRDASALQQRGYRDFALAKDGNRLPGGEPRRAGKSCRLISLVIVQRELRGTASRFMADLLSRV
jgi:hypothetical protein